MKFNSINKTNGAINTQRIRRKVSQVPLTQSISKK